MTEAEGESTMAKVGIVMGSDSDMPVMSKGGRYAGKVRELIMK